jgi:mono/diheme cytochrome c family protein
VIRTARTSLLLILAAVSCAGAGCRAKEPKERAWFRPLRNVAFERTEARRERGRYLAEGVLQCFNCHSDRDTSNPGAPPAKGKKGAGHVWYDEPAARLVAPNITPDRETGAGTWSDDMLARAIREGVGHDGRPLHPQMWYDAFGSISDDDVAAVVVFLRSIPPVENPLPPTRLKTGRAVSIEQGLFPLNSPVPAPDLSTPAKRGRYLVQIANCQGCHTAWEAPLNPGRFGGGNLIEWSVGGTKITTFSRNLTSDPTGIPYYDDALFIEAMRRGRVRTRDLSPLMPWIVFRNMTDDDLKAVLAYLKSVPQVRHFIDPAEPVATCPACGQEHGGGKLNQAKEIHAVPVDSKAVAGCEGTYVFPDAPPIVLVREKGRLFAQAGNQKFELFTEDNRRFFIKVAPDIMEFVRDKNGRVTNLVNRAFDDDIGRKVKS